MQDFTNVAITGASSGLGRALALGLAHPGVTLHLAGRDAGRLGQVAVTARALGAAVMETVLDVTDAAATAAWIEAAAPTLVIANAGISAGPGDKNLESPAQIRAVFATNVDGVFNTVLPAITVMQKLPPGDGGLRGRIVIIGSIAGLIASPASPAYSAAKAALDFWVSAAAPNAAKDGVGLTIVRPGFIRTPMTAGNPYKMPGLMDADQAARIIIKGLQARRTHITFPVWLAAFARFGNLFPKSLLANLPKKPAT